MRLKAKGLAAFLLVFCMAFTACSAPAVTMQQSSSVASSSPVEESVSADYIYEIPLSSDDFPAYAYVTAAGKEVLRGENIEIITDQATGDQVALMQIDYTYGYDIDFDETYVESTKVRLFALDGSLLRDWEKGYYYLGFNHFIWYIDFYRRGLDFSEGPGATHDDVSELIDMRTGESKAKFIGNLKFLQYQDSFYVCVKNLSDDLLGIYDYELSLVTDATTVTSYDYISANDDLFVGVNYTNSFEYVILDLSLKPIMPDVFYSLSSLNNGFAEVSTVTKGVKEYFIFDTKTSQKSSLKNLLPKDQTLIFYDGKNMISCTNFNNNIAASKYFLYKTDGTLLASDFDSISYPYQYEYADHYRKGTYNTHFYGIKDGTLHSINSEGEFLYSLPTVQNRASVQYDAENPENDFITFYTDGGDTKSFFNGKLEPIFPSSDFELVNKSNSGYIFARSLSSSLFNVYSSSGRLLIKDLYRYSSSYRDTVPGRIIGIKDNTVILMDEGGNWIWHDTYT